MGEEEDHQSLEHSHEEEESLLSKVANLIPPDFDPSIEQLQSPHQDHQDQNRAPEYDLEPDAMSPPHPSTPSQQNHPPPPVPVPPKSSGIISPFSLSVGLAIFLALLYNIYILL